MAFVFCQPCISSQSHGWLETLFLSRQKNVLTLAKLAFLKLALFQTSAFLDSPHYKIVSFENSTFPKIEPL